MPEYITSADRGTESVSEAVRVHTNRIEDACIDKDCIEDLRVWLTTSSQEVLERAVSCRARAAELLYVQTAVESIPYHPGNYAVDLLFYYRVTGEVTTGQSRPVPIAGLCVFGKRVVLHGSARSVKVFTSEEPGFDEEQLARAGLPRGIVEAVDPVLLSSRIAALPDGCADQTLADVPQAKLALFDEPLVLTGQQRQLFVTLGQFSTVRLERSAQLSLPVYDYAIPDKQCTDDEGTQEPCEQFSQVDFPMDAFFPAPLGASRTGAPAAVRTTPPVV